MIATAIPAGFMDVEGTLDGVRVGLPLGSAGDGLELGLNVGFTDGFCGLNVGIFDGCIVGTRVLGVNDGILLGLSDGVKDGALEGM